MIADEEKRINRILRFTGSPNPHCDHLETRETHVSVAGTRGYLFKHI